MNSNALPLILGLLGAGALGAASARFFASSPTAEAAASQAISPTTGSAASAEQVAGLVSQLDAITQRLDSLEMRASTPNRQLAGEAIPQISSEQLETAVSSVLAKQAGGTGGVQNLVANTLDQIRAQEEVQTQIKRDQTRQDAIQARVEKLTEELGLFPDQASDMVTILTTESTKRDELRNTMRSGGADFSTVRESFQDLRDETQTALSDVLSEEQLKTYNESNSFGFGGPGGGGRRPGGDTTGG